MRRQHSASPPGSGTPEERKRRSALERWSLERLGRLRRLLLRELDELPAAERNPENPHLCCLRPKNRMRISPLEARAILEAFRATRSLRARLPEVLDRLARALPGLRDSSERQPFDCPLLEGRLCLVHRSAKPIGCLAWNDGRRYTPLAWRAFAERDRLNDRLFGPRWKLRVIPLWLARVLDSPRPHGRSRRVPAARAARADREHGEPTADRR